MKIPLKYNLRSLWVRRFGTLMTAIGIGLTVFIVVIMMALVHGLNTAFTDSGQDNQLIVIRQGSLNEVNSYYGRNLFPTIRDLDGVAEDENGEKLIAGEIIVVVNWPRLDGKESNLVMRGTSETGLRLRPELTVTEGRLFREGLREVMISRSISNRFKDMSIGNSIQVAGADWKIVGLFDVVGGAYDSELFTGYEDVAQEWRRPIYSSILLRAESAQASLDLQKAVADDQRIRLQAVDQKEYFAAQTDTSAPVSFLGTFVAIMMGTGACFAAMNMMYGTIMARVREVATLRALGFRRRSILSSFLIESMLLTLLGGIIGCIVALPVHGITTGTTNLSASGNFSEMLFQFRITPTILAYGMAFSLGVGLLGGFFPSLRAARLKLIDAMRN